MCGIAGSVGYNFNEEHVLKRMRHRGPDEQATYLHDKVKFYHLRLSILDIACGKQPMHLGEKFTIVFNGEIFNHQELRNKFGLSAITSSDTETLLLLYEKLGAECLKYLDGMFAFAIHDKIKNILFIARDRAGVKPLYYYSDSSKFVFASELNGLRSMLPLEICNEHFYQYLRFGSFYKSSTPYKNVSELNAGTYLEVDCTSKEFRKAKWWNIHEFYLKNSSDNFENAVNKVDQLLHQAIKRRIDTSDLEVGAFLSGGIDSGLVTAIAKNYNSELKTFTVSFDDAYDEAPLAKLVANKYQTTHHEIKISFDNLQNDIEKILGNYGEPFADSSAIPSYYVSKAAKEFVTVILNGDGADELFGGYRRYVPFAKYDFFQKHFFVDFLGKFFTTVFPPGHNKKSMYNYVYRLASFSATTGPGIYLSAGIDIFEGFEKYITTPEKEYLQEYFKVFEKITNSNLSGLQKLMNLDFDINLFGDLLVKMDIATMANSQEGRSPFLCKEILEYAPALPDNYKIHGKQTKYLLRNLAKKYLPAELIDQPKRGFEIPLKKWVNDQLRDVINDHLLAPQAYYQNFVEKKFIHNLMENKINISGEKRAKILWTLFAMEVWKKANRNE